MVVYVAEEVERKKIAASRIWRAAVLSISIVISVSCRDFSPP